MAPSEGRDDSSGTCEEQESKQSLLWSLHLREVVVCPRRWAIVRKLTGGVWPDVAREFAPCPRSCLRPVIDLLHRQSMELCANWTSGRGRRGVRSAKAGETVPNALDIIAPIVDYPSPCATKWRSQLYAIRAHPWVCFPAEPDSFSRKIGRIGPP